MAAAAQRRTRQWWTGLWMNGARSGQRGEDDGEGREDDGKGREEEEIEGDDGDIEVAILAVESRGPAEFKVE